MSYLCEEMITPSCVYHGFCYRYQINCMRMNDSWLIYFDSQVRIAINKISSIILYTQSHKHPALFPPQAYWSDTILGCTYSTLCSNTQNWHPTFVCCTQSVFWILSCYCLQSDDVWNILDKSFLGTYHFY